VQVALNRALHGRLKLGWRTFWKTAFKPVEQAGYGVRSRMGGRFAGFWLHPGLHQALDASALRQLHPLLRSGDILLTRCEGKLTTTVLPGFWAHAAIFLGDRADLSALDSRAASTAGQDGGLGYVIEAVSPCVRIATLGTCLDADHVLVLRPALDAETTREALTEAMRHLGKPYDFEFDFNRSHRVVCTGLVYRSYHGRGAIQFDLVKRLGNFTLTGDDLVHQALAKPSPTDPTFDVIALGLRRRTGWQLTTDTVRVRTVLQRIARGWKPVRP
jgi:hypothetical protein